MRQGLLANGVIVLVGYLTTCASGQEIVIDVQRTDKSDLDMARNVSRQLLEHFNGRDFRERMRLFRYPHFKTDISGRISVQQNQDDIPDQWRLNGTTFENYFDRLTERIGWHHSKIDRIRVLQAVGNQVALIEDYTRFNAAGDKIANGPILRVLTKRDNEWKVQLRSDVFYRSAEWKEIPEFSDQELKKALAVNEEMGRVWNERDLRKFQEAFHCPHLRIGGRGELTVLERSDKVPTLWAENGITFDNFFDWFSDSTGWHHTKYEDVQVLGKMVNSVHIIQRYTRYGEEGSETGTYQSVRVLRKSDDRWGVRARATVRLK